MAKKTNVPSGQGRIKIERFHRSEFLDRLYYLGLREETEATVKKMFTVLGLQPPNVSRTEDVMDRITYSVEINRYILSVHTKVNRKSGLFSRKGRRIEIVIARAVDYDSKRLFYRGFNITPDGSFIKKIEIYVQFLCEQLRNNRPLTQKQNWAELKEIGHDQFFWVDEEEEKIHNFFIHANAVRFKAVYKDQRRRLYYTKVRRKKLGIRRRLRDIKKVYTKRKKKK